VADGSKKAVISSRIGSAHLGQPTLAVRIGTSRSVEGDRAIRATEADRSEAFRRRLVGSPRSNSRVPSCRGNDPASSHDPITVVTKDIHPCC
jgi:hypothetical protein